MRWPSLMLSSVLLAVAIPPVESHRPLDLSERRAELAKAHEAAAQAASVNFIGAVADAIAPEGFYVSALTAFGTGPVATKAFLVRDTANLTSHASLRVVRLDVSADGNDGYSYGYLDVIRSNGDTLPGSFKAYWRRNADGKWQALAFGRGRREKGVITWAPDSLRPTANAYPSWPSSDSTQAWGTLKSTEIAFSDSTARNVREAFMFFAAPDASKISGAGYVFGRAEIGKGFETPPPGFAGLKWHAERGTVAGSNDLGFNVGPVTARTAPPGSQPASGGMFFTVWRRQPNGDWKYIVD